MPAAAPAARRRVDVHRGPRALALAPLLFAGPARAAVEVPPAPSSAVTDRAEVLSPAVEASLARRLALYEAQSGHQIVAWIDRSTGGPPIEEFAVKAFEAWKIGRAGLDDGLAVFAMTEDRTIRVEVGYGLEPIVTDLATSTILRTTMIPRIRRGEWDAAMTLGVEALVDTIEGHPGALPADPGGPGVVAPDGDVDLGLAEKIGIGVLAVLFLILLITNPRLALMMLFVVGRGGRGGGGFGGGGGGGGGRSGGGGATGRW